MISPNPLENEFKSDIELLNETLEEVKEETISQATREFNAWFEEHNGAEIWEIQDWWTEKLKELI